MNSLKNKYLKVAMVISLLIPFFTNSINIKAEERYASYIDEVNEKIIISEEGYYVDLDPLTRWLFENDKYGISQEDLNILPEDVKSYVNGRKGKITASANGPWSQSTNSNWIMVSIIKDSDGNTLWCLDATKTFPNGNGYTAIETKDNQGMWNLIAKGVADGVGYADIQIAIYAFLAEQAGSSSFYANIGGGMTITNADVRTSAGGYLVDYGHNNNFFPTVNFNTSNLTGTYNKTNNTVESQELVVDGFNGPYSVTGLTNGLYLIDAGTGNRITDPNNIPQGWTVKVVNPDPSKNFTGVNLTVTSKEARHAIGVYYTSHDATKQNLGRYKVDDPIGPGYVTLNFETVNGDIEINKRDDKGNPLANADITLLNANKQVLETKTTDANGKVVFNGYVFADYFYQETKAPNGYVLDSTMYPITHASVISSATLSNNKQFGRLQITKTEKSNDVNKKLVANAEYTLTKADGTWSSKKVTDANGYAEFTNLDVNTNYKLQETKSPNGYVLNNTIYDVYLTSDPTKQEIVLKMDVENEKQLGILELKKTEDPTSAMYINQVVPNAEYTLTKADGTWSKTQVTDANGYTAFIDLEVDTLYKLQETKAPEGYVLDTTVRDIYLESDPAQPNIVEILNLTNKVIEGNIYLIKSANNGTVALNGAIFGIYKESDGVQVGTLTSGSHGDGMAISNKLRFEKEGYYVQEIKAPKGYWLDETKYHFDITVNNEIVYKMISNEMIKAIIQARKVDSVSKLPLAGVKFKIADATGEFLTLKYSIGNKVYEANEWITDDNGEFSIETALNAGDYFLVEVEPLEGYLPLSPIPFTIDENQDYINLELIGNLLDLGDIENQQIRGCIDIQKVDKDTRETIPNTTFELYDHMLNLVKTVVTGDEGSVTVCDLVYGDYYIKEIDVPAPYIVMDQTLKKVSITENGKVEYSVFENEKETAVIKIAKTNDSGKFLQDVKFEMKDVDGIVLQTVITDENGLAEFAPIALDTKVFIQEVETIANHILDDTIYEYEFKFKDKETPIIYTQLDVVNVQEKPELPETGQPIDLLLSAVGFSMIGLFILNSRKRFNQ